MFLGWEITKTSLENIIEGRFKGTGIHINSMYKDSTIPLELGRNNGFPLLTAATAMQLFQAGNKKFKMVIIGL